MCHSQSLRPTILSTRSLLHEPVLPSCAVERCANTRHVTLHVFPPKACAGTTKLGSEFLVPLTLRTLPGSVLP